MVHAGTREPRMQRLVARSITRLMRALTNPLTTEYGCSHSALSRSAICLSRFLASRPIDRLWKPRMARMIDVTPNKGGGNFSSSPFLVFEVRHGDFDGFRHLRPYL
jgi:hypothetical protein